MKNENKRSASLIYISALLSFVLLAFSGKLLLAQTAGETILRPADVEQIIPKTVFFRGQSAPVQLRNAGGLKFADGMFFLAALVDTSGYSTSVKAKYQAYLMTEVPIEISGKRLAPGAYGIGFIADHQFVVMDIGAHDILSVSDERDEKLRRPTPLQMIASDTAGMYRLYEGREFVTIKRKAD